MDLTANAKLIPAVLRPERQRHRLWHRARGGDPAGLFCLVNTIRLQFFMVYELDTGERERAVNAITARSKRAGWSTAWRPDLCARRHRRRARGGGARHARQRDRDDVIRRRATLKSMCAMIQFYRVPRRDPIRTQNAVAAPAARGALAFMKAGETASRTPGTRSFANYFRQRAEATDRELREPASSAGAGLDRLLGELRQEQIARGSGGKPDIAAGWPSAMKSTFTTGGRSGARSALPAIARPARALRPARDSASLKPAASSARRTRPDFLASRKSRWRA